MNAGVTYVHVAFTVHLQLHYCVALVHNFMIQSIERQSFAILLLYTVFCLSGASCVVNTRHS
jgi:hypothetical protein